MNAADAFAQNREPLEAQLCRAATLEEAISACTMALEKTACLLMQQEPDKLTRQRQQAVLALARRAPQLLRAAKAQGELVVASAPARRTGPMGLSGPALGGLAVLAALAGYALIDGKALFALAQLAGAAMLALGLRGGAQRDGTRYEARAACTVDARAMAMRLQELCQAVDVCVSDLALLSMGAGQARLSGTADEATLDLLTALMEAKASGRPELAMRSLDQAEQYLHMLGLEIVPYSPQNAAMFDLLPTLGEPRTIRPALLRDGKPVRRGTAACRMERSVGL